MRETVLVTQGVLGQRRECLGINHLVGSGNYQVVSQGNWALEGELEQEVGSDFLPSLALNVRFCSEALFLCLPVMKP